MKQYIEQAIKSIEAEREQKTAQMKDKIMREKIAPFNAEVDSYRAKALTEVDNELNTKIADLKKEYEEKKKQLIALGEEKKKTNAESVLASELAVLTIDYDKAITKLKSQLSDISE